MFRVAARRAQRDLDAALLSGRLPVAGYLLPVRAYPMI
jgi:hypothetical protein